MSEILVLGATGTTGSRVAEFLRHRGVAVRSATRTPGGKAGRVRFDWADDTTYAAALHGVSAVYLVAPVGVHDPVPVVAPFLELARRAGVRRVVVLGSSAVPESESGLGGLYRLVRSTVPEWTVLRPSWFMQNFGAPQVAIRQAGASEIVSATGEARIAFIDAADIAAVAGYALLDAEPHNTEHLLTGPEALSYDEVAAIITEITGRPLTHRRLTAYELARHFTEFGLPADFALMLAALDDDIRAGAENRITHTVERITGRPPRSFAEFVTEELRLAA
ncbi:NmrA family NAD(P)-binding protein [Nocardia sp. NPDC052566]|uniref:NAD(P)H-binding protein n=1 Tax=Nocardia sp. NPDC052566 TaxID=3364330 RepID=UPI0037C5F989